MPSTAGKSVARKIVTDALRFNWSGIEIAFAVRCTAGVAIVLIAAAAANDPLAGASAAYGALVTGLASRQGVYRTRVAVMLAASSVLALSALAGSATGWSTLGNIGLLAVWSLVFGIVASLGRAATLVSVNACVAFIIFSNAPYDTGSPLFHASMVLAGGVLQMLLLVLVWPLQHYRTERTAIAAAYTALGTYARSLRGDDLGLPDSQSLATVSETLSDPQPFGGREELAAYQALADEAERLRGTLAALATEQHLLDEVGLSSVSRAIRAACASAAPVFDTVAEAVAGGHLPARRPDLPAFDATVANLEKSAAENAPYVADARALGGQLRGAVRSAAAAATGGLAVQATEPHATTRLDFAAVRSTLERLAATCTPTSLYARHAIRLTVALVIAVIVQHLVPLAHAQWIGLTVVLVLRPDFSSTFTRGVGRVAGTFAGAIAASLIAAAHPDEAGYIALAIGFAALGFALFNVSYALFSLAITGYVVFLLALGGAPEHASALDRVAATAIGGAIALVAYLAWPAWSRALVGDDLAALVEAQRRFVAIVLEAYVAPAPPDDAALRAAQVQAWRARANAEASVDQMAGEPVRPHAISHRDAARILTATRRLGIAGLTLRARIARIEGAPHAIIERFRTDADGALRTIAAALRSGEPPAPLPALRNDQIALKRVLDERHDPAVEVLVSETDLIVDSIDAFAEILAKHGLPARRAGTPEEHTGGSR